MVKFSSSAALAECRCLHPQASDATLQALAGEAKNVAVHLGQQPGTLVVQGSSGCDCSMLLTPRGAMVERFAPDRGKLGAAWRSHVRAAQLLNLDGALVIMPLRMALMGLSVQLDERLRSILAIPQERSCSCLHEVLQSDDGVASVAASEEPVTGMLDYAGCMLPRADLPDNQVWNDLASRRQQSLELGDAVAPSPLPAPVQRVIEQAVEQAAPNSDVDLARRLVGFAAHPADIQLVAARFDRPRISVRNPNQLPELLQAHALRGGLAGSVWFRFEAERLKRAYLAKNGKQLHAVGGDRIDREEMPQIPFEEVEKFLEFLRGEGITTTEGLRISPALVKPTQKELNPAKIKKMDSDKPVLISEENKILDGHHRWANALGHASDMPATKIHAPIHRCLELARKFLRQLKMAGGYLKKRKRKKPGRYASMADRWSSDYLGLRERVGFAIGFPDYGDLREDVHPPATLDTMVDQATTILTRRFSRPFDDEDRFMARDAFLSLPYDQALQLYRRLVEGGEKPRSSLEAGDMFYRVLGRSELYEGEDAPEDLRQALLRWEDGKKHLKGLLNEGSAAMLARRSFISAWRGVNQAVVRIMKVSGRLTSSTPVEDRPLLTDHEEAYRTARRLALDLRRDIEKNAADARDRLANMLSTDHLFEWNFTHEGAAQTHPPVVQASNWLKKLVSRRLGEEGTIKIHVILEPKRKRAAFRKPDTIIVGMDDRPAGVCHLLGHALEWQLPRAGKLCNGFLRYRCRHEVPTDMGIIEGGTALRGELGRLDTFDAAFRGTDAYYVGKVNPDDSSEVLAMGLESIWDDPLTLATTDPEFFLLIIGILKGDLREVENTGKLRGDG